MNFRGMGVVPSNYVQVFISLIFCDIKKKQKSEHKPFKKLIFGGPFAGSGNLKLSQNIFSIKCSLIQK